MKMVDREVVESDRGLNEVLGRARKLGFTGPGDVADHIRHALRFVDPVSEAFIATGLTIGVDLGSGAGLPGLVLAVALPDSKWILVDAMERRTVVLTEAVGALGLADRVEVRTVRAEALGRDPSLRNACAVVTARSFGQPAVVAECGAPLLVEEGLMVVSEPPGSEGERWPAVALSGLGLEPLSVQDGVMVCRSRQSTPEEFPRRIGLPAKRPLF
jgi:16S rRNA G527 N7-methylase RsmG